MAHISERHYYSSFKQHNDEDKFHSSVMFTDALGVGAAGHLLMVDLFLQALMSPEAPTEVGHLSRLLPSTPFAIIWEELTIRLGNPV